MDESVLRERAKQYVVCYNTRCPRKKHCLRWLAGPYVPATSLVQTCVNVTNEQVAGGDCPMYRSDEPIRMKRGFTHLYDNMPRRTATAIRLELDAHYGHTTYYKYRNGKQPVTPDMQQHIAEVCQRHGWTKEPVYDGETEEYNWL